MVLQRMWSSCLSWEYCTHWEQVAKGNWCSSWLTQVDVENGRQRVSVLSIVNHAYCSYEYACVWWWLTERCQAVVYSGQQHGWHYSQHWVRCRHEANLAWSRCTGMLQALAGVPAQWLRRIVSWPFSPYCMYIRPVCLYCVMVLVYDILYILFVALGH